VIHSPNIASPLGGRSLGALLFAVFVVAVGYGAMLPLLPLMVERLLVSPDPASVARHTTLLTAVFAIAPLAAAFPWGRLSDRRGRRPILVLGLAGFAVTLAASAFAPNLALLYLTRLLNGGFASAVFPTALALVADKEGDEAQRARTFGYVSVASSLGLLAGPMLGGFASDWGANAFGGSVASLAESLPSLLVATAATAAVIAVLGVVHGDRPPPPRQKAGLKSMAPPTKPGEIRLLVLAAVAAGGLGAFEVGITLRSRVLTMTPAALGLMFAACMVVMLIVQGVVFSSLVKPATTRWLIAPSFALMGLGLALIPMVQGSDGLLAATGMVAASGGLLSPMLTYWISRVAGRGQGAELGLQSAIVSLGQALGSLGGGIWPGLFGIPGVAFLLPAMATAIAAAIAVRLPALLAPRAEVPLGRSTEAGLARQ
jgi:MFS family permease